MTPVSVIVPCYRCASTIARAVASIAKQSQLPYEVILVEDASGDSTLDVLKSLKNQYGDWLKIVELTKNNGAASARNIGWNLATQPYIAFLDSDDSWHPKKIEIQYQYMKDNPNVVINGHLFRKLLPNTVGNLNWDVELSSVKIVTWLQLLMKNQFVTPSIMLKRNVPIRFSEGKRYMEDHLLWLEVVGAGYLATKLNIELAAIYKPIFGVSGLSSNMWLMEKAELSNYQYLYKQKKLKFYQYCFLVFFSMAKYFRRLFIVHVFRKLALLKPKK